MGQINPPRPLFEADDLSRFDCGKASLNSWLKNNAKANQKTGATRTNVVTDDQGVVAYVSLAMGSIERSALRSSDRRNAPDPMPVLLLARLAIDVRAQGRGIGKSLLQFVFRTALKQSESIGFFAILTHPIDDGAMRFYSRWGFQPLPRAHQGVMVLRLKDLQASLPHAEGFTD